MPSVILDNIINKDNQIKSPQPIEITYGYSRDHRPDLKQFINASNKLKKLLSFKFDSYQEAVKSVDSLNKQLKYHQIDNVEYKISKSKNKKDQNTFYQINASLSENINAIKIAYNSAGRFVLATNVLDEKSLSNNEMLSEYKAQQSCERGFRFLKDPLFFADSIFLKSSPKF